MSSGRVARKALVDICKLLEGDFEICVVEGGEYERSISREMKKKIYNLQYKEVS